jgi:hypothetical protein
MNKIKLTTFPNACPTALQVEAHPTFLRERISMAHPSTAISWVAIKKYSKMKKTVNPCTSGAEPLSPSILLILDVPKIIMNPHKNCTGISHDFRRPKAG